MVTGSDRVLLALTRVLTPNVPREVRPLCLARTRSKRNRKPCSAHVHKRGPGNLATRCRVHGGLLPTGKAWWSPGRVVSRLRRGHQVPDWAVANTVEYWEAQVPAWEALRGFALATGCWVE